MSVSQQGQYHLQHSTAGEWLCPRSSSTVTSVWLRQSKWPLAWPSSIIAEDKSCTDQCSPLQNRLGTASARHPLRPAPPVSREGADTSRGRRCCRAHRSTQCHCPVGEDQLSPMAQTPECRPAKRLAGTRAASLAALHAGINCQTPAVSCRSRECTECCPLGTVCVSC